MLSFISISSLTLINLCIPSLLCCRYLYICRIEVTPVNEVITSSDKMDEVITSLYNCVEVITSPLTFEEVTTSTMKFDEVILDQLNIK